MYEVGWVESTGEHSKPEMEPLVSSNQILCASTVSYLDFQRFSKSRLLCMCVDFKHLQLI